MKDKSQVLGEANLAATAFCSNQLPFNEYIYQNNGSSKPHITHLIDFAPFLVCLKHIEGYIEFNTNIEKYAELIFGFIAKGKMLKLSPVNV